MMGLCQGNGTAPASWLVLSSLLVKILCRLGYEYIRVSRLRHTMGPLTTHCWCCFFWESLDYFGFKVAVDYPNMPLPRQGDKLLITEATLRSLNCCRIAWHLLFLSDIVNADGRQIKLKFLIPPTVLAPIESELSSAEERPMQEDLAEWASFWGRFTQLEDVQRARRAVRSTRSAGPGGQKASSWWRGAGWRPKKIRRVCT